MKDLSNMGINSCSEVNALDIVSFLDIIGHRPTRSSFPHFWYLSPLRDEKTASFKVNKKNNSWYDFGIQEGGTLVDFCMRYYNCTVEEVLQRFSGLIPMENVAHSEPEQKDTRGTSFIDLFIRPLQSIQLLRYLMSRNIDQRVAQDYCKEAYYRVRDKNYYAIAFENRSGGYELRNKYFKGGNSPKDISFINNRAPMLCVFEGFIDFLSFMTATKGQPFPVSSFLILNSIAFLDSCQDVILKHSSTLLYLDNDPAGDAATKRAVKWSQNIHDQRAIYRSHKDLNEWLCNIGHAQPKSLFNSI